MLTTASRARTTRAAPWTARHCSAAVGATYTCATTAANSFTRPIKIKASAVTGNSLRVNFDYLFAVAPSSSSVNDGLNAPGRYFVYDPDVVDAAAANKESSGATAVSRRAAAAFVVGIVALLS